jgi:hypothetical protein
MMKFLRDSYNGLYVVLLKPYMPRPITLLVLVIGVIVGLLWAYAIAPTVYYDADPSTLHQSWQDEWVKLLADRNAEANADISANITDLLSRVDNPLQIVDRLMNTPGEEANVQKLQDIRPYAEAAEAFAVEAPQPNMVNNILPFIIAPLVVVIVGTIVAILWGMFIQPNLIDPLVKRARGEKVSEEVQAMRQQVQASRQALETQKTDFAATTFGTPLMQRMSTYILGHGQYDDSFSIEDENERFLGECGAGISETIGVGEPQKATAVEVWLFDKDDFVRTITKVFVSEHAFNDPALRAKLEPKGDLVLAEPGATVLLETASLRLQARIVELEYGTGPLPPRSYFQKLTVELAAWRKEAGASVPAAAATVTTPAATVPATPVHAAPAPAAPQYAPPTVAAPPAPAPAPARPQPSYTPAPQPPPSAPQPAPSRFGGAPARPAAPVTPPPPPQPVDDDPFGGTGDFTPIS